MKRWFFVLALVFVVGLTVSAQKLPKPKKVPNPTTPEQHKMIQDGIALHDAKKFDEAIAKYQSVLAQNPDSTLAIYEVALSQYVKGDKSNAKATALRGSEYISDHLPMMYSVIANCLDDEGKTDDAIKIYREAEDILKNYPDLQHHLSGIYYNLGISYVRQKKYTEARTELKRGVEKNFSYASPHYLLSVVYQGTKYPVPAFLAASRFISLEYNTTRTQEATAIIAEVLKPAPVDPKTGNMNIFVNIGGPKDEGDYGMYEIFLGTLTSIEDEKEKAKKRTENEKFIDGVGSLIDIIGEDKKLASTFVGKNYAPFVVELKKAGHLDAFGNMILYINNGKNADAAKWVNTNNAKLSAFIAWAKAYQPK